MRAHHRLISFFPCAYDCAPAAGLAEKILSEILQEKGEPAARRLLEPMFRDLIVASNGEVYWAKVEGGRCLSAESPWPSLGAGGGGGPRPSPELFSAATVDEVSGQIRVPGADPSAERWLWLPFSERGGVEAALGRL